MSKKCIQLIKAASRSGKITDAQASELINGIKDQAMQRKRTKNMLYSEAVKAIAGEMQASAAIMEAIQRRNILLSYKRMNEAIAYALKTSPDAGGNVKPRTIAGRLRDYLNKAYQSGNLLGKRFQSRFHVELKSAGVYDEFLSGKHDRDIYYEIWRLDNPDSQLPLKNKTAAKVAEIWRTLNRGQVVPMANRHGAYIDNSPGWIIPQSHDATVIRSLANSDAISVVEKNGRMSLKVAGRGPIFGARRPRDGRAMTDSQQRYWKTLEENGINIDWERSLDGSQKELWMKNVHNNLYTGRFGEMSDGLQPQTFKAHGSLANQMSTSRVLWFADPDSAWKYNQLFGTRKSLFEATNAHLESSGKQIAIMQHLGPNSKNNLTLIRTKLEEIIQQPEKMDQLFKDEALREELRNNLASVEQSNAIKEVRSRAIDNDYSVLSGEANISTRPELSRIVDNIKALQTLAKLGGAVISSISDKAFFQNAMARQGFDRMERMAAQLMVHAPKGPERVAYLENIGMTAEVISHTIAGRYLNDFSPWRALKRASDFQFNIQGMNWWVRTHEQTASEVLGMKLGSEASTSYGNLSEIRRRNLHLYGIEEPEWDALRSNTQKGYQDKAVMTPQSARFMSDEAANALLVKRGLKETKANRDRLRDDLEAKISAYFEDFVGEAVPKPGLRERSLTSLGSRRGEWPREIAELLFIFKSFPIAAAMKLGKQFRMSDGGLSGKLWLGNMIFQTALAGYIAMTAKDAIAGKTPRKLTPTVFLESALRGGALGIWGDVLFSEYNRSLRTPLSTLAGPAIGDMSSLLALGSQATRQLVGAEGATETKGYQALRLLEQNIPFANLFYIKPLLENFVWLNMRESLSPGVLKRMEQSLERRGVQEYFIRPTDMGNIPISKPTQKIRQGYESVFE